MRVCGWLIASQSALTSFESTTKEEGLGFLELALILQLQQLDYVTNRDERVGVLAPVNPLTSSRKRRNEGLGEVEIALI